MLRVKKFGSRFSHARWIPPRRSVPDADRGPRRCGKRLHTAVEDTYLVSGTQGSIATIPLLHFKNTPLYVHSCHGPDINLDAPPKRATGTDSRHNVKGCQEADTNIRESTVRVTGDGRCGDRLMLVDANITRCAALEAEPKALSGCLVWICGLDREGSSCSKVRFQLHEQGTKHEMRMRASLRSYLYCDHAYSAQLGGSPHAVRSCTLLLLRQAANSMCGACIVRIPSPAAKHLRPDMDVGDKDVNAFTMKKVCLS
ncbi:hypothetical protein VTO73DRAFT_14106 [Trametes versicolor]